MSKYYDHLPEPMQLELVRALVNNRISISKTSVSFTIKIRMNGSTRNYMAIILSDVLDLYSIPNDKSFPERLYTYKVDNLRDILIDWYGE